MDKIILNELAFMGKHGCLEQEKTTAQQFLINLELFSDLSKAASSDDLKDTVCYASVFSIIQTVIESTSFNLLEALGEAICSTIFENFENISKISLQLTKPNAPISGNFTSVGIAISRTR